MLQKLGFHSGVFFIIWSTQAFSPYMRVERGRERWERKGGGGGGGGGGRHRVTLLIRVNGDEAWPVGVFTRPWLPPAGFLSATSNGERESEGVQPCSFRRLHSNNLRTWICASSLVTASEGLPMWSNRSSETEGATGRLITLLLFFVRLSPHSRRLGGGKGAGRGVASLGESCRFVACVAAVNEPGDFVGYCC